MIEKAAAVAADTTRSRWIVTAALALFAVLLVVAGKAGAPYLFQGATLQSELATQVRVTTGLTVTSKDRGRFDLLPRPHIVMRGLHFSDPSGALTGDAETLDGDVRLLPLLVGRIELGAATLVHPRLAINADGRPLQADSMIGRTLRRGPPDAAGRSGRLGVVTLVDGTISVTSRMLGPVRDFENVDVTIDWPDLDSPATLTGSFAVQKMPADLAIWLAQPSSLMRGETSPLALRVQSTPLDLSANGNLAIAGSATFHGHVAVHAPSMTGIMALAAVSMPLPAPFAHLAMNGDVAVSVANDGTPAVDLSALKLSLDGNDYEGSLAVRGGPKPSMGGTLAADRLSVAPFLDRLPRLIDATRRWSTAPLIFTRFDPIALDLRISASHLRIAPLTIDDAAIAVMTRGDRTEIVLAEGKAYGGDVKARASLGIMGDMLSLRGACTLTNADAATLSWDALGRQVATGTVSGSASLDTSGSNPAALITRLNGSITARAVDGEIMPFELGRGLPDTDDRGFAALLSGTGVRMPFSSTSATLRLTGGEARVEEASMRGMDTVATASGTISLPERTLDLHVATKPSAPSAGPGPGDKPARLHLGGSFDTILVTTEPKAPNPSAR